MNGFDHQAYLAVTKYYSTAWKTGSYPAVTQNQIFLTARPHSKEAVCTGDSVGQPSKAAWVSKHSTSLFEGITVGTDLLQFLQTDDNLYSLIFATGSGSLHLSIGSSSSSFSISPGVNKVKLPLDIGTPHAVLYDSAGSVAVDFAPSGFSYTGNSCSAYNFNYYTAVSP